MYKTSTSCKVFIYIFTKTVISCKLFFLSIIASHTVTFKNQNLKKDSGNLLIKTKLKHTKSKLYNIIMH